MRWSFVDTLLVFLASGRRRWLLVDVGALRRSRKIARALLADIAGQASPEIAALARDALQASALPGDPGLDELLRGPGEEA